MNKIKELNEISKKYVERGEVVSPLNDKVFKALLQDEKCREYLKDLIEGITGIPKKEMKDLKIENAEHPINVVGEKGKISDIIVTIEKTTLILEMNQYYYEGIVEKNLSYMTNIQNKSLKEGESYRSIKKSILINFDNEWRYGEEMKINFKMRSKDGRYVETENIESYHINLEKVKEIYYNENRKKSRLERELMMLTIKDKKLLEEVSKGDRVMEEAKEKITKLTEDREFIGLYDEELAKEREYKDRMAYAEKVGLEKGMEKGLKKGIEKGLEKGLEEGIEKGMKQGLEKGLEQGIEQGSLETKRETARRLKSLGIDVDVIVNATLLSKKEIEML